MAVKDKHYTGGETEGGITSSYANNDGVQLKVPYSFMGSIYDEAEQQAALAAMAALLSLDDSIRFFNGAGHT